MITCYDPFDGRLPYVIVPQDLKNTHKCTSSYHCQHDILNSPDAIAYMKSKSENPRVFFMLIDEESEKLSEANGLSMWCGPYQICQELGNKVAVLEILRKLNIPFIPNVCSRIENYQHLLQLSQSFQTDNLVVQSEIGLSGMTTYFISSE